MNVEARTIDMSASADFLGNGAIEVNMYETEIYDIVRRSSIVLGRIKQVPAKGHPHRYFDQTAIASATTVDPRSLSMTPSSPTRVEKSAPIKATVAQTNIGLFDKEVTQQQGLFASVVATDIEDVVSAIEIKRGKMLWAGSDTSLTSPTTTEWMGLLRQITLQATIALGSSIIDGLKTQVATIMANQTYNARPTAIVANPVLLDYIDQEAKANKFQLDTIEVTAGVVVTALSTQAGKLPLIPDPFMPTDTTAQYGFSNPSPNKNYYAAILTERDIEIPVVSGAAFNPNPRMYLLGLLADLNGQHVGVKFDCVIAKGADRAHSIVAVVRA